MSDAVNDGGPAFPCDPQTMNQTDASRGLSIRDYFAAAAMAAILSTSRHSRDGYTCDMLSAEPINPGGVPVNSLGDMSNYDMTLRWVPTTAYTMADAMLKARSQ